LLFRASSIRESGTASTWACRPRRQWPPSSIPTSSRVDVWCSQTNYRRERSPQELYKNSIIRTSITAIITA
jgi:hypothetical protein